MPKRPSNLETLRFALELLKRIPRTGGITAKVLHEQLTADGWSRDLRTVQRQLEELSIAYDGIERDDRSRPYGYRWKPNAAGLTVPGLNERESMLLALTEQHLANLIPSEVLRSLQPFFDQARRNLAPYNAVEGEGRAARDWMRKVRVVSATQPLLPPPIEAEVFEQVSSALYHNHWLDVVYRNAANQKTSTGVMPLGLAQQGTRLYLVCRFRGHDDDRTLALNRMESARDTLLGFAPPDDFDLEKFDSDGQFGYGKGKRIKLVIRIDKDAGLHLLESRLSEDQTSKELEDEYEIRATVTDSAQLVWWLRGFGDAVEVISPRQLAERLRD